MLETARVTSPLELPAITHVDGSARVQTVSSCPASPFSLLLRAFARLTGCPILLNTSFNLKDEPIVCTPEDALVCFLRSEIDILVLGNCVVDRRSVAPELVRAVRESYVARKIGVSEHTYTLT